jgi:hypothetical protein
MSILMAVKNRCEPIWCSHQAHDIIDRHCHDYVAVGACDTPTPIRQIPALERNKYVLHFTGFIAMNALDKSTDNQADEPAYHERATAILDELAQQARVALGNAGIRLNIFFVVPPSGDAILTLGVAANQHEVQEIKEVIGSIVRRSIGLNPGQCRNVICAMGDADDDAMS